MKSNLITPNLVDYWDAGKESSEADIGSPH